MNPGERYTLTEDIRDTKRNLISKKGTQVEIIWISEPAVIVTDGKQSFTVNKNKLQ